MNQLTRYIDKLDRQRGYVPDQTCPCCGDDVDPSDFDTLCAIWPEEHHEALATKFGGRVCNECADTYEPCDECHEVRDDVKSTTWGDRCCTDCENRIQARRVW